MLVHAAASVLLGWLTWRLAGGRALARPGRYRRRDAVTGLLVLAVVTAAYLVLRRAFVGSDPMYPTTPLADLLANSPCA